MAIEVGDAVWRIKGDTGQLDTAVAGSARTIQSTFESVSRKVGIAMTAAGATITAALGSAAWQAGTFGKSMANVATLGVKHLSELDSGVRDLATRFGIDLNEAAGALYETISAGIPEDAAIKVLEQAARGAQAGVGTLGDALDLGTSVMNAWNIKGKDANETATQMEKIMGMAATAAFKGKTTFADMAQSIGQVAPVTAAAGVSVEEFFAALAGLTATGLPTSSAMAQLQQMISNTIKPSSEAAKLANKLGLEFNAQALASKGLAGFLDSVKQATGGNIQEMGVLFGSVEALGAAISLTGNQGDLFKETLKGMSDAQKTLSEMSDAFVKNNPALAFEKLKVQLQDLSVTVGRALLPTLERLAPIVSNAIKSVADWVTANPKLAEGLTVVVGASGALMFALGPLLMALPGIIAAVGLFGGTATTAAGVAGVGGVAGLSSGLIGLVATLAPAITAIGIGVWSFAALSAAMSETQAAQAQLAESSKRLTAAEEGVNAKLRERGVILDDAIMQQMTYEQRLAYRAQQEAMQADIILRGWMAHYLGRTATEEEFARARNVALNENVTAQEAAMAAIGDAAESHSRALMAADKATTEALLAGYGIRKQVQLDGATELTQAEMDAATKTQNTWAQANNQIAISATQSAEATKSIWQRAVEAIVWALSPLFEMIGALGRGLGLLGPRTGAPGVGMATGGTVQQSGWAVVGERGPELVQMPRGATVYDSQQSAPVLQGGGATTTYQITNQFNRDSVRSDDDIRQIERIMTRLISTGMTANGTRAFA